MNRTDNSTTARFRFRPHHFLCTYCFESKGYSQEFVSEYKKIKDELESFGQGGNTAIYVVEGPDDICSFCPNLRNNLCETEEKVQALDRAHKQILGVREGELFTWVEAKALLKKRMSVSAFNDACSPCLWQPLGICADALQRLLSDSSSTVQDAR